MTLTTDFGYGEYVGAMKGVVLSINPEARLVDISHSITPGRVREGAFVLYSAVPYFPPAVHVAVVDPGVGTRRRGIVIECKGGVLVGPDNGLLIPAARRLGIRSVREIKNRKLCRQEISATFHGRDVFAPVAAHLSAGVAVNEVGPRVRDWVDLDFGRYVASGGGVKGKVAFVDHFGNLITSIPGEAVRGRARWGREADVRIGNRAVRVKFLETYGFGREGEPLLTISSSGFLELSVRGGSAREEFGADEDSPMAVDFLPARKQISK